MCPTDLKEHGVLHEDSETEFAGRARKPKAVSAGAVFEELPGADCPQVNPRSRGERPGSTVGPNSSFAVGATRALDGNRRLISRQKNLWPGRTLSKRHVGPDRWKHRAACGQEQNCEGSNPMSDAPAEDRGTAELGQRIAEQRHEGNWRCMICRPVFPGPAGLKPNFERAMETPAKNRRGESQGCLLKGMPSGRQRATHARAGSSGAWLHGQRVSASFAEGNKSS